MKKLIILFFALIGFIHADIGEISAINGEAVIIRDGNKIPITKHTKIEEKDTIKTAKNTKLQIIFKDHTVISLGQKTVFKIEEYLYSPKKPKARFNISKGLFKSITGKIGKIAPQNFKLKTQNATIGVRGTTIIGEINRDIETIICSSGKIVVTSQNYKVAVNVGEKTIIKRGFKPTPATKISKDTISHIDTKIDPTNPNNKIVPQPKTDIDNKKTTNIEKIEDSNVEINIEEKENIKVTEIKDQWGDWNKIDIIKEDLQEQPNSFKNKDDKKIEVSKELQELRDRAGSSNPTYKGMISGFIDNPLNQISKNNNHIELNFDLGKGTVSGDMGFEAMGNRWDAEIKNGTVDKRGNFDFGLENQTKNLNGSGNGMLTGKQLQNADGSFKLKNQISNQQVFGTFHANKR